MKIVIDIDEETYKRVIADSEVYVLDDVEMILLENAIANGTPLPEHHGRLIDESQITKCLVPINRLDVRGFRTDAPTIIEGSESE